MITKNLRLFNVLISFSVFINYFACCSLKLIEFLENNSANFYSAISRFSLPRYYFRSRYQPVGRPPDIHFSICDLNIHVFVS